MKTTVVTHEKQIYLNNNMYYNIIKQYFLCLKYNFSSALTETYIACNLIKWIVEINFIILVVFNDEKKNKTNLN